jgi:hypothetical protein
MVEDQEKITLYRCGDWRVLTKGIKIMTYYYDYITAECMDWHSLHVSCVNHKRPKQQVFSCRGHARHMQTGQRNATDRAAGALWGSLFSTTKLQEILFCMGLKLSFC